MPERARWSKPRGEHGGGHACVLWRECSAILGFLSDLDALRAAGPSANRFAVRVPNALSRTRRVTMLLTLTYECHTLSHARAE
jgi:hypothetical protein